MRDECEYEDEFDETVSVEQAAALLGVSRAHAYELYRTGRLRGRVVKGTRGRGVVRVAPASLEDYLGRGRHVAPVVVAGITFPRWVGPVLAERRAEFERRRKKAA